MTDTLLRQSVDLNAKIYNRLKAALRLNLRRQIFVAVCDDLALRDRLADQLQKEVTYAAISARKRGQLAEARRLRIYPRLVTLNLDLADPNPINQMSQWLRQFPPPAAAGSAMPAFQLLGIEQLSRQPASSQWLFLNHLQSVERSLPALESSLLIWVPRPWGRMIPQSAPDFWRCRTAVFEFDGDPTPLPAAALPQSTVPTSIFLQPQSQAPLPQATPANFINLSPDEVALLKSELAMPSANSTPLPSPPIENGDDTEMPRLPAAAPKLTSQRAATTAHADISTGISTGTPDEASPQLPSDSVPGDSVPGDRDGSTLRPSAIDAAARSAVSAQLPQVPPVDQPLTAQTEDLSQALRELLKDVPTNADELMDGATSDASANGLIDEPSHEPTELLGDAAEDHRPLPDSEPSDGVPVTILDDANADEVSMGLPPLDDALDFDQLDPFDLDLTSSDLDQLDPADLELEPLSRQPDETVPDETVPDETAPDETASEALTPDALADEVEADAELMVADADPHYVYPGMAATATSTPTVPAAATPSELMQLFADEAADPRVLNVLQQIQGLLQQNAPPTVMAGAYRALGNLFRDRVEQGELSPQTLQRAMAAYQQVLHWTPDASPMRAEVLNDMGNLSWLLSRCSQGPEHSLPHLQQSIQSYQQALTQIAPDTHPQTYPMIQNNLGAAYGDLARYQNPPDNLQKSIQAYQEALRYRSAEQDPMRYASTQNNLGTTYWNLAQHQEPIHHLKAAIAAYDSALSYYKPEQDALNYAMIQNNLGTAYWNLAQHEHSEEWLRQAITAYQLALEYRTLETSPAAFAATQNNLGTAHWHVANYIDEVPETRFSSLQQAMRAYEAALQAVEYLQQSDRPTALNFDVTATQNNLGLVQYQTATDKQFETSELSETYLNTALEHHLAALNGWQGRPELRQTALNCVIQTLQAIYTKKGLVGQNLALSKVPGQLLPEILPKL